MFFLAAFSQSYDELFEGSFPPAPPSHPHCGTMSYDLIASTLDNHNSNGLQLIILPQSLPSPALSKSTFCDNASVLYLPCPVW